VSALLEVLRGERAWWIETTDVLDGLKAMPDECVNCVVTSVPYYGLRDYGTGRWEGGEPACDHAVRQAGSGLASSTLLGGKQTTGHQREGFKGECRRCGAVRIDQQIGLEPTLSEWVAKLTVVFREVRRVLRSDGVAWVNCGDAYATGTTAPRNPTTATGPEVPASWADRSQVVRAGTPVGLKTKDLMGQPWRLAFALQDDGWWLRSDVIWSKPNPMPESVTDRPTRAHEYLFLFTKRPTYWYDCDAIREPQESAGERHEGKSGYREDHPSKGGVKVRALHPIGRNRRTVWEIPTEAFPEAHFATFPTAFVEPCILAGCPEKTCRCCGAPWRRITERVDTGLRQKKADGWDTGPGGHGTVHRAGREAGVPGQPVMATVTLGWEPSCACGADSVPGVALDLFNGSGTTGVVAHRLGRRYIGLELNPAYAEMARKRIVADQGIDPKHAAEVNGTAQLRLLDGVA
jgi:DNA modification methylase